MKFFYLVLLGATAVAGLKAQTPSYTDEQILKAISTRTGGEIDSVEYFRTTSPKEAWEAFGYLSKWAGYYNKVDLAKKAGRAIAENPGVEKYVTEGVAKLPHDSSTGEERSDLLLPLGNVPAPWSVRLLGHYLMDESRMIEHDDGDTPLGPTNPDLAILALQKQGFLAPPPEDRIHGLTPAVREGWHNWWTANENRVEQRIAEINPGYYPPPPTGHAVALPVTSPTTALVATPTPATSHQAISNPTVTPSPVPEIATANDWLLYVAGSVIALGVLGAVVWAFRRSK